MYVMHGLDQFFGCLAFHHITGGTRAQGLEHVGRVLEHGEHHVLHVRPDHLRLGYALDAVAPREIDVHEHHIGSAGPCVLEG